MADIASNIDKLNDLEVSANAPLTEALNNKFGANINGLIDLRTLLLLGGTVKVMTGAQAITPNTTTTILSFTTTLEANDFVRFDVGSIGTNFSGAAAFSATALHSGSCTVTLTLKRGATTLHTKATTSGSPTTTSITPGPIFDKPGAGTYTYTFEVTTTAASSASYGGAGSFIAFERIKAAA